MSEEVPFVDAYGVEVFTRRWMIDEPRGLVLVSHGASEHSGRYDRFARALNEAGWSVVGPVASLERALETIERARLDAALLDVRVNGHDAYAMADVLVRRRIPFIFVSGFARTEMPPAYRHCAYMAKPFTPAAILALLEEVVRGARPQPPTGPRPLE